MVGDDASKAGVHRLFERWSEKPSHRGKRLRDKICLIKLCESRCLLHWALVGNLSKLLTQHFLITECLKNKSYFSPDYRKQNLWAPSFERIHSEMVLVIQPIQQFILFYFRFFFVLLLQKIQTGFSRVQLWIFRLSSCYSEEHNCLNHSQRCP